MGKLWDQLSTRYQGVSTRERALIWLVAVSLILAPAYLFLEPMTQATAKIEKQAQQIERQIKSIQGLLEATQVKLNVDPNASLLAQQATLLRQIEQIDQSLMARQAGLVPVGRMSEVLEGLLAKSAGLKLLEMTSLAPESVLNSAEAEGQDVDFHRHGIRMTLEGRYMSLLAYLQAVESLSTGFLWQVLDYQVTAYPKATIVLELYTLGSSKDFISG
jgi:MSHA biogenesis protein MshJ